MFAAVLSSGSIVPPLLLMPFLARCSLIVAADGGISQLRGTGFRADFLVGDLDSLESEDRQELTAKTQIVRLDADKDDSDTDAAVAVARRHSDQPIMLCGGAGGRLDHWLSNLRLFEQNQNLEGWLTSEDFVRKLLPGQTQRLQAGRVSFFPVGSGPWLLSGKGLRWPVDQLDFGTFHSLSNEVHANGGIVSALEGRFLMIEPASLPVWELLG